MLKLPNFDVYNVDTLGTKAIAIMPTTGEYAGVIITFAPKTIEQMIKFLYDGVRNDKPTKN